MELTFGTFLDTCNTILNGLLSFGRKAIVWFFTPEGIDLGPLGILGSLEITPFELLLDTFFIAVFARIALELVS